MDLELNRTSQGVCPIVVVYLGRRGTGKTTLMQATARLFAERDHLCIVSPIPTLKSRMPDLKWYKISVTNKGGIEKLFRGWMEDGVHRFVLADEADELTAANAAGTAGGFVAQAVYDYINYGREQGLGIALSSRRPANIAKDICANANLVFVANTTDPSALDYYSAWMQDPVHPEVDYRAICRRLKDHYFMAWSPTGGEKFLGFCTVNTAEMMVRPCSMEEALGVEPAPEQPETTDAPSAEGTPEATTAATGATDKTSSSPTSIGSPAASAGNG